MRLAVSKRVRSEHIFTTDSLVTGVVQSGVVGNHIFQDDITIIGVSMMVEAEIEDAHTNTDGELQLVYEITRQGALSLPGGILANAVAQVWNATVQLGGEIRKSLVLMFPEGYGIEVDEGEGVNIVFFGKWVCTGGNLAVYSDTKIYYVER